MSKVCLNFVQVSGRKEIEQWKPRFGVREGIMKKLIIQGEPITKKRELVPDDNSTVHVRTTGEEPLEYEKGFNVRFLS